MKIIKKYNNTFKENVVEQSTCGHPRVQENMAQQQ